MTDIYSIPVIKKKLEGYVGFHNFPNQIYRRSIKAGFSFTLLVVGESGLGKSTLINALFNTTLYPPKENRELTNEAPISMEIQSITADIEESDVKLKLTIVDALGFGDFLNNEDSCRPILENVRARYASYLEQENRVSRKHIVDTRIHACIYLIPPTGHCLRPLDLEFLKKLSGHVNLIPVIAKADAFTEDELRGFKARILEEIAAHKIRIYQPVVYDSDEEHLIRENKEITESMPFAVIGSNKFLEINNKTVLGRQYPWGTINIENEEYSDFLKLRRMVVLTHMEDLKDHTNEVLYENYRADRINSLRKDGKTDIISLNSVSRLQDERAIFKQKIAKMEDEMSSVFQRKVLEKEEKLKMSEKELYNRHKEVKEKLERQLAELEDKKRKLEISRAAASEKPKKKQGLFK